MFEIMFRLIMVCCLFGISLSGLMIAAAMWRKSNSLCDECRKELDK
jgi:protein-tyrosine phosphatase